MARNFFITGLAVFLATLWLTTSAEAVRPRELIGGLPQGKCRASCMDARQEICSGTRDPIFRAETERLLEEYYEGRDGKAKGMAFLLDLYDKNYNNSLDYIKSHKKEVCADAFLIDNEFQFRKPAEYGHSRLVELREKAVRLIKKKWPNTPLNRDDMVKVVGVTPYRCAASCMDAVQEICSGARDPSFKSEAFKILDAYNRDRKGRIIKWESLRKRYEQTYRKSLAYYKGKGNEVCSGNFLLKQERAIEKPAEYGHPRFVELRKEVERLKKAASTDVASADADTPTLLEKIAEYTEAPEPEWTDQDFKNWSPPSKFDFMSVEDNPTIFNIVSEFAKIRLGEEEVERRKKLLAQWLYNSNTYGEYTGELPNCGVLKQEVRGCKKKYEESSVTLNRCRFPDSKYKACLYGDLDRLKEMLETERKRNAGIPTPSVKFYENPMRLFVDYDWVPNKFIPRMPAPATFIKGKREFIDYRIRMLKEHTGKLVEVKVGLFTAPPGPRATPQVLKGLERSKNQKPDNIPPNAVEILTEDIASISKEMPLVLKCRYHWTKWQIDVDKDDAERWYWYVLRPENADAGKLRKKWPDHPVLRIGEARQQCPPTMEAAGPSQYKCEDRKCVIRN